MRFLSSVLLLASALSFSAGVAMANDVPFSQWAQEFKKEARGKGISDSLLNDALDGMTPNDRVLELDQNQPEGTMTFAQYQDRVVSQKRIQDGRKLLATHRARLERISQKYGVQPQYIVALWGIETNFGANTGGFSVVEALATLAYDGRRSEFFRKELLNALQIINEGHIALDDMKGSWAGAMGQCQFMPSSFLAFAQDSNSDGRKDIWGDLDDVFASIANYLSSSGWEHDSTWGREVSVPVGFDKSIAGIRNDGKTLAEWRRLGIHTVNGQALPGDDSKRAWLVFPGKEGEEDAYIVYENYRVVMKWNRSTFFATSVGLLADQIAK